MADEILNEWIAAANNCGIPSAEEAARLLAECPMSREEADAVTPPWAQLYYLLLGVASSSAGACIPK